MKIKQKKTRVKINLTKTILNLRNISKPKLFKIFKNFCRTKILYHNEN